MSFPASIAARVGSTPIIPTTAVRTISALSYALTAQRPSIPLATFIFVSASFTLKVSASSSDITETSSGLNSLACFSISSIFLPHERATTFRSPLERTMSKACVPIEPVEPIIEMFFILHLI